MKKTSMRWLVPGAAVFLCACSHMIAADYPQYLINNAGTANLPRSDRADNYFLTPNTETFRYEFRAFLTGAANLWVVEFGRMLDDTLQSADVQAAFGSLKKTADAAAGDTLVFDLQDYVFTDFRATVSLRIALWRSGKVVFEKVYKQSGKEQIGKMVSAGAFGQKNAVQQSTKLAVDEILRQLIADLNALPPG
jgi:hypothetical protein